MVFFIVFSIYLKYMCMYLRYMYITHGMLTVLWQSVKLKKMLVVNKLYESMLWLQLLEFGGKFKHEKYYSTKMEVNIIVLEYLT